MKVYQVDAFTDKLFGGNPAAVIPLKKWLSEKLMQQLAMENSVSETAFFVPSKKKGVDYDIRWFTPEIEINLCGHATLASSYVLFKVLKVRKKKIVFFSKSGQLIVEKKGDVIEMDFPSWKPEKPDEYPANLEKALGVKDIVAVYKSRDWVVELNTEDDVKLAAPDFTLLKNMNVSAIITAPGRKVDFVSRFFAPPIGIDEDPVTGAAHSQLIPFWSEKLGKTKMKARQLSKRGGDLIVEQKGDKVIMAGKCVFYMQGEIKIK